MNYQRFCKQWYDQAAQSPLSSVTFNNVIVCQSYSLYYNTLLAGYTEVKYQLKESFLHANQIWQTADWNRKCITKRRNKINQVSTIRSKCSVFPTFTQHHVTTWRNNVTQCLTAILIDCKHITTLCLSTLCHEKQVIWTY